MSESRFFHEIHFFSLKQSQEKYYQCLPWIWSNWRNVGLFLKWPWLDKRFLLQFCSTSIIANNSFAAGLKYMKLYTKEIEAISLFQQFRSWLIKWRTEKKVVVVAYHDFLLQVVMEGMVLASKIFELKKLWSQKTLRCDDSMVLLPLDCTKF